MNKIITNIADDSAKKKIESIKLPECLQRPLVFGDEEQIKALRNLQEEADGICESLNI
jgi:hypothetical protein